MTLNRISIAGLLLPIVGCVTVQKVQPTQYIPQHSPAVVWVTTTDNAYTPVAQPRIDGDSLKGTWAGMQEPVAISLSEIKTVQAKLSSPKRTVLLATVLTLTVGGAVYSIATAGNSGRVMLYPECGIKKGTPENYC